MATPVDILEFLPEHLDPVVEVMGELAADNSGWLTIDPAVLEEHMPPLPSAFGRLVSNRGPYVPRSTWVPADVERRRPEPMSVGILHATGPRVEARLADKDVPVPERWRAVSDHPKRGLVLYVPIDVDHRDILTWVLDAATALTRVPLTGQWRAAIHRR